MSLATGYTGDSKQEFDLSTLIFRDMEEGSVPNNTELNENANPGGADADSSVGHAHSASRSMASLIDEDKSTVKEVSEDGHSYDGTVVRGGLRRDSE